MQTELRERGRVAGALDGFPRLHKGTSRSGNYATEIQTVMCGTIFFMVNLKNWVTPGAGFA